MDRIFAYLDESGAYGFDFSHQGNSTHFIVTAVTVKEKDVPFVEKEVLRIKDQFGFKNGEIKSSKIKSNNKRRLNIINEIKKLPLKAFVLVVDKRKIFDDSGIRKSKSTFYKFLNDILYQELRICFNQLEIQADEIGDDSFMSEFYKYVKSKETQRTLFDDYEFAMSNSKHSPIIQVADLISGSLSYAYEPDKIVKAGEYNFRKILGNTILIIKEFPRSYDESLIAESIQDNSFNPTIFNIAYRRANDFIEKAKNQEGTTLIEEQKFVLKYLLFRFINNSSRRYIGTHELISALESAGFKKRSIASFRMQIIAKLRDHNVIISSGQQGYKIPSSIQELCEYISHTKTVIMPMISRLRKCIEVVKTGSNGDINPFDFEQYAELKNLLE